MTLMRRAPVLLAMLLSACGNPGPTGVTVDEVQALATANCEASTAPLKMPNELMLPGRACGNCHRQGGQAAKFIWSVAGTVYGSRTASCNSGGLPGVKVEILDDKGNVQTTLTTNAVGNFYTPAAIKFPMRARISKDAKSQQMLIPMATGTCATCHQNPGMSGAPGRISLD